MSGMQVPENIKWWHEATFGMFIHWGIYAVPARGEWVRYHENIPQNEYAKFADEFTAKHYSAKDWVALAQDAGMKYMVLTTRHHDGFCLFDSSVSDFTAPRSAAGRDLVAEYVDACHDAGMRMGFYYSNEDWRFPHQLPHLPLHEDMSVYQPMVEQCHAQVRELMTNYGQVDILWYDGAFPADIWRVDELHAMARGLQPGIIINDRCDRLGDFGTPEQNITPEERPWEACFTMNSQWGYSVGDTNFKSVQEILGLLASCTARGGNLLLNVGPDAEGMIPRESVDRLREIGKWMRVNGKAVYGVQSAPMMIDNIGHWTTHVGGCHYMFVDRWPGSTITLGWVGNRVLKATVLATGDEARIEQKGDRVWLRDLPQYAPDQHCTVIELEIEGEPRWPDVRFT
jgi:alpha-L-fucosidase